MPIYAFQCNACGHRFDELMRLSDPDPSACPACGAAQVQRQVTAPAFRLAGAGWYETDFKGDKDRKRNLAGNDAEARPAAGAAATEPPATTTADAKAEAKAESKPAAKPAAEAKATPAGGKPAGGP